MKFGNTNVVYDLCWYFHAIVAHSGVGIMDTGGIFSALRLCRIFLPHFPLNCLKAKTLKRLIGCCDQPRMGFDFFLVQIWGSPPDVLRNKPQRNKERGESDPFYCYLMESKKTRSTLVFQGQSGFQQERYFREGIAVIHSLLLCPKLHLAAPWLWLLPGSPTWVTPWWWFQFTQEHFVLGFTSATGLQY